MLLELSWVDAYHDWKRFVIKEFFESLFFVVNNVSIAEKG